MTDLNDLQGNSKPEMRKKLFIATFGCQMNDYDSLTMSRLLHNTHKPVDTPEEADLIIINTCSIREKAENKLYSLAGRYRHLKEINPDLKIAITGCVAQQEGARLLDRMPYVDIVLGPQGIYRLPSIVNQAGEKPGRICINELDPTFSIPLVRAHTAPPDQVRASITIMQGCDNFCTYCIVPTVRGREISRPPEDIIEEIRQAVELGAREIILLGQNVNSYGKKAGGRTLHGHPGFAELLEMVDSIRGVERLRFTTSHPRDLDYATARCFGTLRSLCEHIHLPVQSGATPVLKRMNRHYSRQEYLDKVSMLKSECPEITITTDLIVGFPGETERDFEQTVSLLEEIRYDQLFVFKYSPRPGTPASRFPDQIPEEVKTRRIETVLKIQEKIGLEQYARFEDTDVEILVESHGKEGSGDMQGRTRGNHVVHFPGTSDLLGKLVTVRIERACKHSLRGRLTACRANGSDAAENPVQPAI